MKPCIGLVALVLGVASCTGTNREQEKEIGELRSQLEQAKAAEAKAKAAAAQAEARVQRAEAAQSRPISRAAGADLYEQGLVAETEGRTLEALRLYDRAARSGSGKAALRLGEIYDREIPGDSRDYAQSLKWYNAARVLGEEVPMAGARSDPVLSFERAQALEREGRGPEAAKAYVHAARWGNGKAAKRLGEIYDTGIPGVGRSHTDALRWYNLARGLGEDVPLFKAR
jgi:TPR repeat protein